MLNLPKCTLVDGVIPENFREVGTGFKKHCQIKRCVCDDIKTYLDEEKVENLQKSAANADGYMVTSPL